MKTALRWLLQVLSEVYISRLYWGFQYTDRNPGASLHEDHPYSPAVRGRRRFEVRVLPLLRNSHFPCMSYRRSLAQDPDSRLVTRNQDYSLTAPELAFYELFR